MLEGKGARIAVVPIIAVAILAQIAAWYTINQRTQSLAGTSSEEQFLEQRLGDCGSLPNGSAINIAETSRVSVTMPDDIYPDMNFTVTSHGATANYVANNAMSASGCTSNDLEFDISPDNKTNNGIVVITSKSAVPGIPDYLVHFNVSR